MLEPRAGDQQQHENDHEALLRLGENEELEEAFHRLA
jgi:hypothetical protein